MSPLGLKPGSPNLESRPSRALTDHMRTAGQCPPLENNKLRVDELLWIISGPTFQKAQKTIMEVQRFTLTQGAVTSRAQISPRGGGRPVGKGAGNGMGRLHWARAFSWRRKCSKLGQWGPSHSPLIRLTYNL